MKKIFSLLLFTGLSLSTSHVAQAQFSWQITLDQSDDTIQNYTPIRLACDGNNCTAIVYEGRESDSRYEFLRSTDAGLTWKNQWTQPENGTSGSYHFVFAVQQIDSLNVVAVGDSGHIFRTFDGGTTWTKQVCPPPYSIASIWGVNFHDPLNGIIGLPDRPATTSDGGLHWNLGPYTGFQSQNCHCYGGGSFAVFNGSSGKTYLTHDNWTTFDSTSPITDTNIVPMIMQSSQWSGTDTIIGYGYRAGTGEIIRSSDAGMSWHKAILDPEQEINAMSSIQSDTIIAGVGNFALNHLLFSSDNGNSWTADTVPIFSKNSFFPFQVVNSVCIPSPGVVLVCVLSNGFYLAPGLILRGTLASAGVNIPAPNVIGEASVYPNPATDQRIYVNFDYRLAPVRILDCLGRQVMQAGMPTTGMLELDISRLSKGIYYLIDDRERAKFVKE